MSVELARVDLLIYRGGGICAVRLELLMVAVVGLGFFVCSGALFRKIHRADEAGIVPSIAHCGCLALSPWPMLIGRG
jgi:hypothetical protein